MRHATFGFPVTGTILGLLAYIGWSLTHIYRLDQWITNGKKGKAPEVRGIFGYFLDESVRQKKQHRRENKKLKAALNKKKLDRIVKDAQGLAEYNHHQITAEFEQPFFPGTVDSDLYSAFSNLIFNAVRHTPPETAISVSCSRSKSGLRAVIEDSGQGGRLNVKSTLGVGSKFYAQFNQ